MSAWLDRLSAEVEARRAVIPDRPFVVGLTGGVASGKSRVARRLAERLTDDGMTVEVVTTDGFLFPNAVLAERGLMDRKGFPDSYDWDGLTGFLAAVAAGEPTLVVPTYSHEAYDVGETRLFARPQILILEGLIALDDRIVPLDLALYLHAAEDDLIAWYTERFMTLGRWAAPRLADRLATAGSPQALARDIWDRINAPVLRDHVLPNRARADIVLEKASDHSVRLAG